MKLRLKNKSIDLLGALCMVAIAVVVLGFGGLVFDGMPVLPENTRQQVAQQQEDSSFFSQEHRYEGYNFMVMAGMILLGIIAPLSLGGDLPKLRINLPSIRRE